MADEQPTIAAEHWKPIPGWEGYYEASDHGRIRSVRRTVKTERGQRTFRAQIIKSSVRKDLHFTVGLYRDGAGKCMRVHRLVMAAFVGPCPDGMEVCHNNGDPADNRLSNLRYDTRSENMIDASAHGTHNNTRKRHCPRGHVLILPNLMLSPWRRKGYRMCLACGRARGYVQHHSELKPQFDRIADSYYSDIMRDAA